MVYLDVSKVSSKYKILTFLKYLIGLLIAIGLLWYVFKDWDFSDLRSRLIYVDYSWVFLSVLLSIFSHLVRAYRWNLLLIPLGYKQLTSFRTFIAVMIGYFINLLAPRAGEITKCGIMKRNDGVNMSLSLGSVLAERVVDLLSLMAIVLLGLIFQFDKLSGFILGFFQENSTFTHFSKEATLLIIILLSILITIWWFRLRIKRMSLYFKIRSFIIELADGFKSILKLENRLGFFVSTLLIWILYFLMTYVVLFSLPFTSHLGLLTGFSILVMGGIGMSAPIQGGFGVYHILVGSVLGLYGVIEKDGYFFATLVHTSQTLSVLFVGGLSLIISLKLKKKTIKKI